MTRLLTLVTVIFAIISLASAQFVDTLNTPLGPVTVGAKVPVTWTLIAGVDASGKTGELTATDSASKNTITIDSAVQLAPKSYTWNVQVAPGTYTLGLNDGSGLKQSGEVVVRAAAGGTSGTPPGASGAPASSASAPASPAPSAPSDTSAPVPTGGSSSGGGSSASGSAGTGGSGSGATVGGAATTDGSSSSQPSTISTPTPKSSSASLIFSGYEVLFSLLVIAIAMVQF